MGSSTRPPPLSLQGLQDTKGGGQDCGSPLSSADTYSTYYSTDKPFTLQSSLNSSYATEQPIKPRSSKKKDKKADAATPSSSPTGSYYTHYGRHTNEWLFHGYSEFASRIMNRSDENNKHK